MDRKIILVGMRPIVFCLLMMLSFFRAEAQYLDPIGNGLKYGCGVADNAKKVFSVSTDGSRRQLASKEVLRLIKANQGGSRARRLLASDLQKCIRGNLRSVNACDALSNLARGTVHSSVVQGRLCSVETSPVVQVASYVGDILIEECSGVMISEQVLLTAAHCMYGGADSSVTADRLSIRVGEQEYSTKIVGFSDSTRHAKPQFEYYDIGYAVFEYPIRGIVPLGVVPRAAPVRSGERVVVAGFGRDETGAAGDLIAGYTALDQVGEAFMTTRYRGLPGESTTCFGDSGGALLVSREGRWVLAGIVSYGTQDCGPIPNQATHLRYGYTNFYHEPLYNVLSDSTCLPSLLTSECPLPLITSQGSNHK